MKTELITKETLDAAIEGGKSIANVIAGTSTELMNEAIALFIMESILSILKVSAVFVVFFIVKKYCDTMQESSKDAKDNGKMFHSFKTAALVSSIIFFTASSFPHIQNIGKAIVAPKIFLLAKANELRK